MLDHRARVAYACRSPRTDEAVAREWAREMGYELEMFTATDERGTPIYHTNVLMTSEHASRWWRSTTIAPADRARISDRLGASAREVLAIDRRRDAAPSPATCWRWAAGTSTWATSTSW